MAEANGRAGDEAVPGAGVNESSLEESSCGEVVIGSAGQRARWSVSPWGGVAEWAAGDDRRLDWFVAADDRWHVPSEEPAVRQRRVDGVPVVETRVRVPDGDVVQRVWAVPDRGGLVVMEMHNDSPLPVAVAVVGDDVITERPPADVPAQGIDLPDHAIVLPIGHQSVVRVVQPSLDAGRGRDWPRLAPVTNVIAGWSRLLDGASRLNIPDETLRDGISAARSDLVLRGPVDGGTDPVGFLLDVGELVRCGDEPTDWLVEMIAPAERVARELRASAESGRDATGTREALDALAATLRVAVTSGDRRAASDVERVLDSLEALDRPQEGTAPIPLAELRRGRSAGRFVRAVERRFVDSSPLAVGDPSRRRTRRRRRRSIDLLAGGLPRTWLGQNFDVQGLPAVSGVTASFAIRWHGERPAVLWECGRTQVGVVGTAPDGAGRDGAGLELRAPILAPDWSSSDAMGEALWPAPPDRKTSLSVSAIDTDGSAIDADGFAGPSSGSFS